MSQENNVYHPPLTRRGLADRFGVFLRLGIGPPPESRRVLSMAIGTDVRDELYDYFEVLPLEEIGLAAGDRILPEGWQRWGRILLESGRLVGAAGRLFALRLPAHSGRHLALSPAALHLALDLGACLGIPGLHRVDAASTLLSLRSVLSRRVAPELLADADRLEQPRTPGSLLVDMWVRLESAAGAEVSSEALEMLRTYWRDYERLVLIADEETWAIDGPAVAAATAFAGTAARLLEVVMLLPGRRVEKVEIGSLRFGLDLAGILGIPWIRPVSFEQKTPRAVLGRFHSAVGIVPASKAETHRGEDPWMTLRLAV